MSRKQSIDFQPLKDALDRDWKDETPQQIIVIAANGIYWRTRTVIDKVVAICQKYTGMDGIDQLIDEIEDLAPYPPSPSPGSQESGK